MGYILGTGKFDSLPDFSVTDVALAPTLHAKAAIYLALFGEEEHAPQRGGAPSSDWMPPGIKTGQTSNWVKREKKFVDGHPTFKAMAIVARLRDCVRRRSPSTGAWPTSCGRFGIRW